MGTALEKIRKLSAEEESSWLEDASERKSKRFWANKSFQIAVQILCEIRNQYPVNGMTQKKLAEAMGVTPQYINKVVKGKENLTLETISKIESILGIKLFEIPSKESPKNILVDNNEPKKALGR
jgi:ribosome-binding protein aMBF1 (putative translation factor)